MKNLLLALLVFSGFGLHAQKQVEKEVDYRGESVNMKLELASAIEVKTWNKPTILVRASVLSEESKINEEFDLVVTRNGSNMEITSNALDILKKEGEENTILNRDHDFKSNYIIYVPKGIELELSSITGSLTSDYLEGNIKINLITGNIDIKKFEGDLALKTITGKIDLPVKNSSFEAKTLMGEIYANADPNLVKKENFVGREMKLDLKQAKNRLSLNTITGDIHLQ